jgi:hypothetical protein
VAERFVNYKVGVGWLLVCAGVDFSCALCNEMAERELVGLSVDVLGIGDDLDWRISHNVLKADSERSLSG